MQQFERYGVLALLLLVVTLLTVGLWGGAPTDEGAHEGTDETTSAVDRREEQRAADAEEARRRAEAVQIRRGSDPRLQQGAARTRDGAGGLSLSNPDGERAGRDRLDAVQSDAWAQERERQDRQREERRQQEQERLQAEQQAARDLARLERDLDLPAAEELGLDYQRGERGTTTRNTDLPPTREEEPRGPVAEGENVRGEATREGRGTAPSAPGGTRKVVLQPGDALSRVVERELGSWGRNREAILALNPGLDPDQVRAGQTILLPAAGQVETTVPSIAATTGPRARTASRETPPQGGHAPAQVPGTRRVTIRKGESLSAVAVRELGSWYQNRERILALNPGLDPDGVRAGQTVLLPSGPTVADAGAPATPARARQASQPAREERRNRGGSFLSSGNYSSGGVD